MSRLNCVMLNCSFSSSKLTGFAIKTLNSFYVFLQMSNFNLSFTGDRIRGGGVCANLPVFFSHNSGLVAVVPRETVSMLPEMMEDSLCSSLAGPGSEVQARCHLDFSCMFMHYMKSNIQKSRCSFSSFVGILFCKFTFTLNFFFLSGDCNDTK